MATSNVYKPGWRSRRRSRLSLVERAVPRLGRMPGPETKPKPDTSPARLQPPKAEDHHRNDDESPEQSREHSGPLENPPDQPARDSGDSITVVSPRRTLILPSSNPSKDVKERTSSEESSSGPADDTKTESSSSPDAEIELDRPVVEETPAKDETSKAPSPEEDAGPTHDAASAKDQAPVAETTKPAPVPTVIEGSFGPKDEPIALDPGPGSADVQLDWGTLISSGFVDPRDRTRPLPANMDDIARALVRQALSDQSSWRDRIILVSSARESRSKSMTALNCAFALTTINSHSVVLLDANMDGSGAVKHLGAPKGHAGLTTALCDSNVEIGEMTLTTNLDRLTLVASGAFEEDILDRFASRRMLEILRFLTKDPDTLLVLDAPPILSSQEATVLSVIAGQVVLVVEAGTTDENSINQALKRIGDRHNISLVLSEHAGIAYDEPEIEPSSPNDDFPLPVPRRAGSKRRLRSAVASAFVSLFLGMNALFFTFLANSPHQPGRDIPSLHQLSSAERSTFEFRLKPIVIGGVAR